MRFQMLGSPTRHPSLTTSRRSRRLLTGCVAQDNPQHGASRRSWRHSDSHETPISDRPMFLTSASSDVDAHTITLSYGRAQENWETLTADMVQRWAANGGKGRKITVNASGMVCTSYEGHLRRFPGTLLSEMVRDPSGALHKKR
jgi:hypothetical protein